MRKKVFLGILMAFFVVSVGCNKVNVNNKTVKVDIGYQSVTAQTWGALVVKNKKIFEEKLKKMYPNKTFEITWHDETSGAIINNNMVAQKYQIGFMGDMPCLINGYKGITTEGYTSALIALDGKGENGKNQSILISKDNNEIKKIEDLEGKTVAVPIGSSAHRMLLNILKQNNLVNKVNVVHQEINIASDLLKTNKIDALAAWDPYPRYLTQENQVKTLANGEESKADYLTGIMVNKKWAEDNRDIVVAFLESLLEAHKYLNENYEEASKILSLESKFPNSITLDEVRNIRWDAAIYKKDTDTLKDDLKFLSDLNKLETFEVEKIIDTSYLDTAVKNLSLTQINSASNEWSNIRY